MRIRIYAIVLVLLITLPLAARAQTIAELQARLAELLAQVAELQKAQTPAATPGVCPVFTRTLQRGASGTDVTELQGFLKSRGLFNVEATGYFGPLTEAAVQAFQSAEDVVSSGDALSTGYGVVGPRTRAAISATCAVTSAAPTHGPTTCPAAQQPIGTCATAWLPVSNEAGCHIGWQCTNDTAPAAGGPPVIERIDGPLQLFIGETGTWNVAARDPDGGTLVYAVTWGDEGSENLLELLAGYSAPTFIPVSQLTHSYTRGGIYTPSVTVRDSAGEETVSTFSVTIAPRPASTSPAAIFSPGIGACFFGGISYAEGTETEGYTVGDLCLATGGICPQRSAYIPKFKCTAGTWQSLVTNPYPNLPLYANSVGTTCPNDGAFKQVVVEPGDQLCRGLLCAIAKTYTPIQLRCQYVSWVDWGAFSAGATTTTVCAEPTPCEYVFGDNGRACASKEFGICKAAPYQNHPANAN